MSFKLAKVIQVKYYKGNTLIPLGRLAWKERKIFFEYAPGFLEYGLELSPFKLPLKAGVMVCDDRVFDGLFGLFNDSLPDGWGRLLIDRKLMKMGVSPGDLSPLDRLQFVGAYGMGALQYEPEIESHIDQTPLNDLDMLAEECYQVQENNEEQFIDHLIALNGSSAGARPKILVHLLANEEHFSATAHQASSTNHEWIIKFRSALDPKDIGPIEYAYHLMAIEAGLEVPEARLFKSKKCAGYFGVKRFDRQGDQILHMHTVSGLLHVDHRIPSLDYETLMKATLWLTKDSRECEKQFRLAVFNVFAHNRDDHAKNFSFLMNGEGRWSVSPAYDLTFSSGPAGEHCTTVMGEGKNPGMAHLFKLAQTVSIRHEKALEIIAQVKEAISKWNSFATAAQVSIHSRQRIERILNQAR